MLLTYGVKKVIRCNENGLCFFCAFSGLNGARAGHDLKYVEGR